MVVTVVSDVVIHAVAVVCDVVTPKEAITVAAVVLRTSDNNN